MTKTLRSTDHPSRVYGLDILRALAILFVMIGHSLEHSSISPLIQPLQRIGILGVELFFVLSGFLIGSIIIRLIISDRFCSIQHFISFWKRRWLRTLPLYLVALLAFLRFDYHGRHEIFDFPLYFLFMQNLAWKIPNFFELSWSLAIEEHFYFWFPIVFLIWSRITQKSLLSIVATALTFVVVAYIFRLSHPLFTDWNEYNRSIRLVTLSRIDAIMFGVLIAAVKQYWFSGFNVIRKATPVTAVLFLIICVWWFAGIPQLLQSRGLQINLWTVQAIICALLLPWFDGISSKSSDSCFFVLTSKLSYSLYLVHILVIIAVNSLLVHFAVYDQIYLNPFILYPLYFSLFYLAAWFTYNQIEKPFLQLRDLPFTYKNVFKASRVSILISLILIDIF